MGETTQAAVAVPAEVRAYAAEMHVEPYLPAVLELARRHYPRAELSVLLDEDREVEDLRHIVIRAWGADMTVREGVAALNGFVAGLFEQVPHPNMWVFRISPRLSR